MTISSVFLEIPNKLIKHWNTNYCHKMKSIITCSALTARHFSIIVFDMSGGEFKFSNINSTCCFNTNSAFCQQNEYILQFASLMANNIWQFCRQNNCHRWLNLFNSHKHLLDKASNKPHYKWMHSWPSSYLNYYDVKWLNFKNHFCIGSHTHIPLM